MEESNILLLPPVPDSESLLHQVHLQCREYTTADVIIKTDRNDYHSKENWIVSNRVMDEIDNKISVLKKNL